MARQPCVARPRAPVELSITSSWSSGHKKLHHTGLLSHEKERQTAQTLTTVMVVAILAVSKKSADEANKKEYIANNTCKERKLGKDTSFVEKK